MTVNQTTQNKNLRIPRSLFESIKSHAIDTFPNECCGFFFGSTDDAITLSEVQSVKNSKTGDQSRRFEIDPIDYMKAERYALENDLELLGIYHSHPNHPAIPSEHDLKQAFPDLSYIIISIKDGEFDDIRSWRLNEDKQFEEENII